MRQVRAWAAAGAVLALLITGTARADEQGFLTGIFGSGQSPKPEDQPRYEPSRRDAAPKPLPDPREQAAREFRKHQDEYLRRMAVIGELKLLAHERGDEEKLAELEQMAADFTAVYEHKIGHLPVARLQPVGEAELDSRLGRGVAVNPLTSTQQPSHAGPAGTASRDRRSFMGENR